MHASQTTRAPTRLRPDGSRKWITLIHSVLLRANSSRRPAPPTTASHCYPKAPSRTESLSGRYPCRPQGSAAIVGCSCGAAVARLRRFCRCADRYSGHPYAARPGAVDRCRSPHFVARPTWHRECRASRGGAADVAQPSLAAAGDPWGVVDRGRWRGVVDVFTHIGGASSPADPSAAHPDHCRTDVGARRDRHRLVAGCRHGWLFAPAARRQARHQGRPSRAARRRTGRTLTSGICPAAWSCTGVRLPRPSRTR